MGYPTDHFLRSHSRPRICRLPLCDTSLAGMQAAYYLLILYNFCRPPFSPLHRVLCQGTGSEWALTYGPIHSYNKQGWAKRIFTPPPKIYILFFCIDNHYILCYISFVIDFCAKSSPVEARAFGPVCGARAPPAHVVRFVRKCQQSYCALRAFNG